MKTKELKLHLHRPSEVLKTERFLEVYDLNPMDMPVLVKLINEYMPTLLRSVFTSKSHFVETVMVMKDQDVDMDMLCVVIDILANMPVPQGMVLLSSDYTPLYENSNYGFHHDKDTLTEALNVSENAQIEAGKLCIDQMTRHTHEPSSLHKNGSGFVKEILSNETTSFTINCLALLQMVCGVWDMKMNGGGLQRMLSEALSGLKDVLNPGTSGIDGMGGFGPFGDKGPGMDC